jgi:hypothetical protein
MWVSQFCLIIIILATFNAALTNGARPVSDQYSCSNYKVPALGSGHEQPMCRDLEPFEVMASLKWLVTKAEDTQSVPTCSAGPGSVLNFPICTPLDIGHAPISTPGPGPGPGPASCVVYMLHGDCTHLHGVFPLVAHWLRRECIVRYILPYATEECLDGVKKIALHKQYFKSISWHIKLPAIAFTEVVDVLYLEDYNGRGIQALGVGLYAVLFPTKPSKPSKPSSASASASAAAAAPAPTIRIKQFSMHIKYGCSDLKNSDAGASRGWAAWAVHYFLSTHGYNSVGVLAEEGTDEQQPHCFSEGIYIFIYIYIYIYIYVMLCSVISCYILYMMLYNVIFYSVILCYIILPVFVLAD